MIVRALKNLVALLAPDVDKDFVSRTLGVDGAPAAYTTAGAVTYLAADILSGIIVRDCNGAGRSDVLPTAALLRAAFPTIEPGDIITFLLVNGSDANEAITIGEGSGGTWNAAQIAASRIVAQNSSKLIHIRFTETKVGSEAYVIYA